MSKGRQASVNRDARNKNKTLLRAHWVEELQSPKTTAHLPKSINSKHWKSEEDFDLEKAAANWGGGGGGGGGKHLLAHQMNNKN